MDREVVIDLIINLMSEFAFIFGDEIEKEDFEIKVLEKKDRLLGVGLDFNGERKGEILMVTTIDLGKQIAINALGLEEDEVENNLEQESVDAIKEFLNIFSGNFLPEYLGNEANFKIGLLEVLLKGKVEKILKINDEKNFYFDMENEPFFIRIESN